jgi:hypothetical protein
MIGNPRQESQPVDSVIRAVEVAILLMEDPSLSTKHGLTGKESLVHNVEEESTPEMPSRELEPIFVVNKKEDLVGFAHLAEEALITLVAR